MSDRLALTDCLNTIEQKVKNRVVVVPGGGLFADQVRNIQKQWQFDDEIAHQMALLAMQQMALLFKSIKPDFFLANKVSAIDNKCSAVIWSPDIKELISIPASWDVTSDSLAAWLAGQLQATELILVKSAAIPADKPIQQMQKQALVDGAFAETVKNANYKITLLNKHSFNGHTFA